MEDPRSMPTMADYAADTAYNATQKTARLERKVEKLTEAVRLLLAVLADQYEPRVQRQMDEARKALDV